MTSTWITPYDLTPDQARRAITELMSDGRERTCQDIQLKTGIPQLQIQQATRLLIANGTLKRTRRKDYAVYRKAPIGAQQEA